VSSIERAASFSRCRDVDPAADLVDDDGHDRRQPADAPVCRVFPVLVVGDA